MVIYFLVSLSLLVVSEAPGVLLGVAAPGFEVSELGDAEDGAPALESLLLVSAFVSALLSALVSVFGEADGLAAAPDSAAAPVLASTPSFVIVSLSMRPVALR